MKMGFVKRDFLTEEIFFQPFDEEFLQHSRYQAPRIVAIRLHPLSKVA